MMRRIFALFIAAAGPLFICTVYAAPSRSLDVRDVMTARQYQQAGLSKLSPQQLSGLNAWLTMTIHQYRQGGLSKLSPQQLKAFNTWLTRYLNRGKTANGPSAASVTTPQASHAPARKTPAPRPAERPRATSENNLGKSAPKEPQATPGKIVSHIDGEFNGWQGNTVFKLQNGQVWKQADSAARLNAHMDSPRVTIKSLLIGWGLRVEGHPQMVFVRRVK